MKPVMRLLTPWPKAVMRALPKKPASHLHEMDELEQKRLLKEFAEQLANARSCTIRLWVGPGDRESGRNTGKGGRASLASRTSALRGSSQVLPFSIRRTAQRKVFVSQSVGLYPRRAAL
jgi:hypothetical protein